MECGKGSGVTVVRNRRHLHCKEKKKAITSLVPPGKGKEREK